MHAPLFLFQIHQVCSVLGFQLLVVINILFLSG
jgi:hypothetical protein